MNEKKVEELIKMLDQFVEDGGGHMNVQFNDDSEEFNVDKIEVKKGLDSCGVQSACQIPTFFTEEDDEF
ncbi:MAG: hypothetical protein ACLROI_10115 [Beduini sp.]|uniref:hypothetical protein n=1 Tax=Beduini sp. TaxID=1922300 RepID=UPI0011CBDA74